MITKLKQFLNYLLGLKPSKRKLVLIFADLASILISIRISFYLTGLQISSLHEKEIAQITLEAIFLGIILYGFTGQYNSISRYLSSVIFYRIAARNFLLTLGLIIINSLLNLNLSNTRLWILFWILITSITSLTRIFARDILRIFQNNDKVNKNNIIIYGAGEAGAQLASSIQLTGVYNIKGFIDDDFRLWGRDLYNVRINPKKYLSEVASTIDEVLLAIPAINNYERKEIVNYVQNLGIKIRQVPSIKDLTTGNVRINDLRPISIEDLLGREAAPPNQVLLEKVIDGSVICVTGAGGSIGSEICRQVLKNNPSKLVLVEQSELALYTIYNEINSNNVSNVEILPLLGNACDYYFINKIFEHEFVDLVFHSAAYKHVPLVEMNAIEGLTNNVLSTESICRAAEKNKVKQVILISTDKAVRPKNVMGASKRVAELIIQNYANKQYLKNSEDRTTCYSMVRFGNVLGSSGSVIPLFQKQIKEGGPITLTDSEMERYFMTIEEASQLVLQSSALADGGEVFLLDMGEPIKIKYLAEQMIKLSGLTVKDKRSGIGDIEIITTGIRPGEKLYEELLIDGDAEKTINPLIYRAKEYPISYENLSKELDSLFESLKIKEYKAAIKSLDNLVEGWSK
ncbi:nucleoside-diphosphate sugar epimerase/dehydratase [Prochlorococcus sp. MIT 1223]|uniref:polysaccharide biosynthesis protein n=1 Tax=Prochlorococcus sp. MIT 1223 TaxID=3096217 RepID=UPI002A74DA50|nr:nucleoside-diphosphate sugar epimerase/dehydratase [Prochlorococcus sp. MIT 1223]